MATLKELDELWARLTPRWTAIYAGQSREALEADLADLKARRAHYCANCLAEREVRIECLERALSSTGDH
jgi:hypothetical protein